MVQWTVGFFCYLTNTEEVYYESISSSGFSSQYHRANSKKNTIKTCEYVLTSFVAKLGKRDLISVSSEEVLTLVIQQ